MAARGTETRGAMFPDEFVDIPALADSVSATHARLTRLRAEGRPIGPDGERLLRATDEFVGRVRGAVAEAVAEMAPSQVSRPTPERRAQGAIAASYLRGLLGTRQAAREAPAALPARRGAAAVALDVVPGMVAQAVRNDLARLRVVAGPAVAEAGRRARGLVHVAMSRAGAEAARVAGRLSPLAKFADGARVSSHGTPAPALLVALKPLALATAAGALTFTLVGGAPAQGFPTPGGTDVTVRLAPAGMDRLRAGAPNAVDPPTIPMPAHVSTATVRVPTGPAQASALQTRTDPLAALRGGPAFEAAPDAGPAAPPAPVGRADPSTNLAPAGDGGPSYSVPDAMAQRGTPGAPSKAFIDLAVKTVGLNTENFGDAPNKVGEMIWKASDCLAAFGPSARCKVEANGVTMDFAAGTHTAVLLPMRNVSAASRVVASETRAGGLRVVDRDAMTIVMAEAANHEARLMQESMGMEEESEPEAVAPRR